MWGLKRRKSLVDRVHRKYDEGRRYRAYHDFCRAALERPLPDGQDALGERGFEHVPVFGAEMAASLLKELARFEVASVKKNKPELEGFQIDDRSFRDRLLEAALPPAVDARAARYFGSEYLVHWFAVTRTEPGGGTNSFLWHCDRGPTRHLKLLLYLNDESEHGGNTEFLDREATERIGRRGYVYASSEDRVADLRPLAVRAGVAFRPVHEPMGAGDGILFQPALTLHRGIRPTLGPRTVLTLCLLPSPVPWQEALRRGAMSDLRADEKWHRDAGEVLDLLGLGPLPETR
ncbi:MAG: hypothetical protein O7G30_11540 [Proteobacteria bacterium]|nr:hypothetical protein [Pseudomonadota bacterium]